MTFLPMNTIIVASPHHDGKEEYCETGLHIYASVI